MSTGLVPPRQKKASRAPRSTRSKNPATAVSRAKLDLEAPEIALHAAVSKAVARDLVETV